SSDLEGLVAALVVEPAVVADGQREGEERGPLEEKERREHRPGLACERAEPRRRPPARHGAQGAQGALSERHTRGRATGTRPRSARCPRAAASAPGSRRAPAPSRRRAGGAAGRWGGSCPRRSPPGTP